ncbi:YlbF family regulator [Ruminococcus flavefaciens]|uniref:YlbF family regulator n=1 Tax=Ruminococcus flavefaciens TaxID=1265 RepID=UPI0026EBD37C|nr:YlbF family regulator [Ruminococcus flavefaciens]MDD7515968.1 YlbF family regulator [Ruminococcus flavefaciens]MDY5691667.1 YlbF family regulator [Ruminococcus flavefaciens]
MDIMEMARELGKALQQDDRYVAYMLAKQANDEDKELQEDIARFEDLRMNLGSAMSAEEPDSDNIKALDTELKSVYSKIMKNPKMIVFSGAQQALEKLVSNVQQIISLCANGEDPETCQIPESGCSGSCASCAGCH